MNAGNSEKAPKVGRPARPNQKSIRRTTSSCGVREKSGPLHDSLYIYTYIYGKCDMHIRRANGPTACWNLRAKDISQIDRSFFVL